MMRQVALPVLTEEVKGGWRRTRGHEKDGIELMVTRSGETMDFRACGDHFQVIGESDHRLVVGIYSFLRRSTTARDKEAQEAPPTNKGCARLDNLSTTLLILHLFCCR